MKISVFTPTNDPWAIGDAYRSLQDQSISNWEWLLLLNGNCRWEDLPSDLRGDERVKVRYVTGIQGVGALKAKAIETASGEVLLELDHDDVLHPAAFRRMSEAFGEGAAFVYSNTSRMDADGGPESTEYNLKHGWRYRHFDHRGQTYKECRSFAPSLQSMSFIWYMPNHLRAFRRDLYESVGGYDPQLAICDDQDLMQRMFIADQRFVHLEEPLYFQRIHQRQTQVLQNAEIQETTVELYRRWINDLALSTAKQRGLLALDMGAALRRQDGYLGVDIRPSEEVDIVCDCNERLPFEDNSVGVIRAVDFLQHIRNPVHLMNEFHRVLAHGGMLLSMTPSTDGRGAFQDPTHLSFWNENSFWYYTKAHYQDYVPTITARYQESLVETRFPNQFCRDHNIPYVLANLTAIKEGGDRLPGLLEFNEG